MEKSCYSLAGPETKAVSPIQPFQWLDFVVEKKNMVLRHISPKPFNSKKIKEFLIRYSEYDKQLKIYFITTTLKGCSVRCSKKPMLQIMSKYIFRKISTVTQQ